MSTTEMHTDCETVLHSPSPLVDVTWKREPSLQDITLLLILHQAAALLFSLLGCASHGLQSLCHISGLPEKLLLCVHQKNGVTQFTRLRLTLQCPETFMKFSYKISFNLLCVRMCGSVS